MNVSLVSGMDLRPGDIYIKSYSPLTIVRIYTLTKSKPGKHGAAKCTSEGKNVLSDVNVHDVFKGTGELIAKVEDYQYHYLRVESAVIQDSSLEVTDNGELHTLAASHFHNPGDFLKIFETSSSINLRNDDVYASSLGILCVKLSALENTGEKKDDNSSAYIHPKTQIFWGLEYVSQSKLGL
jgi:translation elongation factor P/translation initiation factor 5A